MRLIDAEALKRVIETYRPNPINPSKMNDYVQGKNNMVDYCIAEIDNAPTVKVLKDTRPQACLNCEYCCYSEMNEKGEILIKCNLGQGEKCLDGGKPK